MDAQLAAALNSSGATAETKLAAVEKAVEIAWPIASASSEKAGDFGSILIQLLTVLLPILLEILNGGD